MMLASGKSSPLLASRAKIASETLETVGELMSFAFIVVSFPVVAVGR